MQGSLEIVAEVRTENDAEVQICCSFECSQCTVLLIDTRLFTQEPSEVKRGRLRQRTEQVPVTDQKNKGLLRKKGNAGGKKKSRKKRKQSVEEKRKEVKVTESVEVVKSGEEAESAQERDKRLRDVLADFGKKYGHCIVGFAETATIYTLGAGLKLCCKDGVSKARSAFEKDLNSMPQNWIAKNLLIELHKCTFFGKMLSVFTLPGHHQGVFPLADITNRQVGCCGLTEALLSAMKPFVPKLGLERGSLLRVSGAVLQAKKKGGINLEVVSSMNAVQLYRTFTEIKHEYPLDKLDVNAAMKAIKETPLQIKHPIFLVSSKNADSGHYLRANGNFSSLRELVPADLLEAIEHDYNKTVGKKSLKRVLKSDEESSTEEMNSSEELNDGEGTESD
jgi:hypothetical protein